MKSNQLVGQSLEVIDRLDIEEGKKIPLLIMSSPGLGKTTTIRMWCDMKGYNLTTLIASQYSQDDILGIQAVNNGNLERLTPSWFNDMLKRSENGKRNVLFIDEITTCDEFLQAPLLNLIFSQSLGLHSLPENTLIVTAGNYSEELNGVFSMTPPLVNRFMILNLRLSDLDMKEVLEDTIHTSGLDTLTFLGLKGEREKEFESDSLSYFISKFIPFGTSEIINNSKQGLVGFTSVRSVYNSINFFKRWCKLFTSTEWTRIVGDTLGSTVRNGNKVLIREFLSKNINFFYSKPEKERDRNTIDSTFDKLIQTIVIGKIDEKYAQAYNKAKEWISTHTLTEKEYEMLKRVSKVNSYTNNLYSSYNAILEEMMNATNSETVQDSV